MTEKNFLRISPSGKFVGSPALEIGPGMAGNVYRKHGTSTTARYLTQTAPLEILGLDKAALFMVDMQPDYRYEIKLDTEVSPISTTTEGTFYPVYSLRDASTLAWSAWTALNPTGELHSIALNASATLVEDHHFSDSKIGVTVTATCDAIAFGLHADLDNKLRNKSGLSHARVEAYTS